MNIESSWGAESRPITSTSDEAHLDERDAEKPGVTPPSAAASTSRVPHE